MNTLSCRSTTPPDNRRRQQEEILSGRQRETSVSFFCVSARRSGGWSLTEAGLPLCEFPAIPSALLRSPAGGVDPGRLCIRLMQGSASERELAHSAGITGNSQSSACHRETSSRRPPALSRTEGKRQRAVIGTAGRVVRRGSRTGPWQPTESSVSFLPSERAPLRRRIPASNGCTEGKETSCGKASEGVQME